MKKIKKCIEELRKQGNGVQPIVIEKEIKNNITHYTIKDPSGRLRKLIKAMQEHKTETRKRISEQPPTFTINLNIVLEKQVHNRAVPALVLKCINLVNLCKDMHFPKMSINSVKKNYQVLCFHKT